MTLPVPNLEIEQLGWIEHDLEPLMLLTASCVPAKHGHRYGGTKM